MKERYALLNYMILNSIKTMDAKVAAVEESISNLFDAALKNVEPDFDSVSIFGSSPEDRFRSFRELTKKNQKPPIF